MDPLDHFFPVLSITYLYIFIKKISFLFMTFMIWLCLSHHCVHDMVITCSWLVNYMFMTCSWHVYDLFMIWSRKIYDLVMTCSWLQVMKKNENLKPNWGQIVKKDCSSEKAVNMWGSCNKGMDKLSSIRSCLPSEVVFHQRSSSIKGHPPPEVIFHQRMSS